MRHRQPPAQATDSPSASGLPPRFTGPVGLNRTTRLRGPNVNGRLRVSMARFDRPTPRRDVTLAASADRSLTAAELTRCAPVPRGRGSRLRAGAAVGTWDAGTWDLREAKPGSGFPPAARPHLQFPITGRRDWVAFAPLLRGSFEAPRPSDTDLITRYVRFAAAARCIFVQAPTCVRRAFVARSKPAQSPL